MFGNSVIWLLMVMPTNGGQPTTLPPKYDTKELCQATREQIREQSRLTTTFCYSQTIDPFTRGNIIIEK